MAEIMRMHNILLLITSVRVNVNESKSWLILKNPEKLNEAKVLFGNTAIKFTTEGKRHLGAALGNDTFRSEYANMKVKKWCDEIEKTMRLCKIPTTSRVC